MQITIEQYRAGYARNAISAQRRVDQVRTAGKAKSGGYTVAELQGHADEALRLSLLSDEELTAHIGGAWDKASGGVLGTR
jgi:hypothetical protein